VSRVRGQEKRTKGLSVFNTRSCGAERVVPFRVSVVASQGATGLEVLHLMVGDLHADRVLGGVKLGVHCESGAGGGRGDGVHDDVVAGQGTCSLVHRDVGEQSVLDLVPLAGPRRQVAHRDHEPGLGGQRSEFGFPGPGAVPVRAASVGGDQQPGGAGVDGVAGGSPPRADGVDREGGGVVVGADADPSGVRGQFVDPVGVGLAQFLVDEVVDFDWLRRPGRAPLGPVVLV